MATEIKKKNWFRRHLIISIFLGIATLAFLNGFFFGSDSSQEDSNINQQAISGENLGSQQAGQQQPTPSSDSTNSNVEQTNTIKEESLIKTNTQDFLPLRSELPTEYSFGDIEEITKESNILVSRGVAEGFDLGSKIEITSFEVGTFDVKDYIGRTVGVYKFNNFEYANMFYNNVVEGVKNDGGYKVISVFTKAECFGWKQDYGYEARLGDAICKNKNIVFWISISMSNTFKQPDYSVKEIVGIVDEKVK